METSRKWYLYQNGKKYGPFSEKTFCAAIDRGKLKNDVLVWRRGMKGYRRITEVEPFKSCFTKPHVETIEKPIPPTKPSAVEEREHEDGQKRKKSNEWVMMSAVSATLGIICLYFWNRFNGLGSEGISRSILAKTLGKEKETRKEIKIAKIILDGFCKGKIVPPAPTIKFVIQFVRENSGIDFNHMYSEYSTFVHTYLETFQGLPFSSVFEFKILREETKKFTEVLDTVIKWYSSKVFPP